MLAGLPISVIRCWCCPQTGVPAHELSTSRSHVISGMRDLASAGGSKLGFLLMNIGVNMVSNEAQNVNASNILSRLASSHSADMRRGNQAHTGCRRALGAQMLFHDRWNKCSQWLVTSQLKKGLLFKLKEQPRRS